MRSGNPHRRLAGKSRRCAQFVTFVVKQLTWAGGRITIDGVDYQLAQNNDTNALRMLPLPHQRYLRLAVLPDL